MILLLDNVNTNTIGTGYKGNGGTKQLIVFADDFGGCVVSLETSIDNISWVPIFYLLDPILITTNTSITCPLISTSAFIRASVSGVGSPTNLTVAWG